MITLHGATLPDGWKAEPCFGYPDLLPIRRNDPTSGWVGGYVTIDFAKRIFAGGSGQPHKHAGTSTYSGRGWKKKIIEDACAWLEKAMN